MHEFSIAEAVLELAQDHVPGDAVLTKVHREAGPMRGIEREAMQWAWQALTEGNVELELTLTPWKLRCVECDRTFAADDMDVPCQCGSVATRPVDCDALRLITIDIDERSVCDASQSG